MTDSWKKAFEAACHQVCDNIHLYGCHKCPFGDDPATAITSSCQMIASNTLKAALGTLKAAGYVVVPIEPTQEMVLAAVATAVEGDGGVGYYPYGFHKGMITAAQKETGG